MERIRQLRKEQGLSQAKLAVMADMDPATLNRLERGTGNPNRKTLERVAGALDVEVVDLFPKAPSRSSPELSLFNGLEEERRPSLRSWIDFVGRLADRWESDLGQREREWQEAEPHIRKNVKHLANVSWASEIIRTYTDVLKACTTDPNLEADLYEPVEAQELYKSILRLDEIQRRTRPWYQGSESPKMAEVIDLQRAMAERVEVIAASSSESA